MPLFTELKRVDAPNLKKNVEQRARKPNPEMQLDSSFLKTFLLVLFAIHSSISQCTNKMCEKKSLSLSTGTKQNVALDGYVFETLNVSIWEECFNVCLRKCQCLSFNFNEVNKTENCELNDASTKLAPDALKAKEGVTYYELGRSYIDEKVNF